MEGDVFLLPPWIAMKGLDKLLPLATPALRIGDELRLHRASVVTGHDWVALAAQLGGGLGAYTAQMDILAQRGQDRLRGDVIIYTTLLGAHAKHGHRAKAEAVLEAMSRDLYARIGDVDALRRVLGTMDAPNVVLLKALVKLQRLQEAEDTLKEMQEKRCPGPPAINRNWFPTEHRVPIKLVRIQWISQIPIV
eukprot:Skav227845  [mRNA]  locus=scaffold4698:100725:106055:- [translate_table: standard]